MKKGYTLIELLVTITIMGVLTALFIPGIDRTLSRNNIAYDASLISSELESARLLAGSTQQVENNGLPNYGFYALYIPSSGQSLYVVRLDGNGTTIPGEITGNPGPCPNDQVLTSSPKDDCLVKTDQLSNGVNISTGNSVIVVFASPTQQASVYSGAITNSGPLTSGSPSIKVSQTVLGQIHTATLSIDYVTGEAGMISYQ